jgi:hypothetical protein
MHGTIPSLEDGKNGFRAVKYVKNGNIKLINGLASDAAG